MDLEIIYEDNHLITVNKRAGDIAQKDKTGDLSLPEKIKLWLAEKYNKKGNVFCGVIHRLDRPTSGVIVYAKTSKALERMDKLFADRLISKVYWAIVEKSPQPNKGTLTDFLLKNKRKNKSYPVREGTEQSKKAVLDYELIAESERYYLVQVCPTTGRAHQIRVQLANIGSIIKGDVKYGAKRANKDLSISLHAREISFIHPVKKEKIKITAKVPKDNLWKWFEKKMEQTNE